jgi:hypothetical protein
MPEAKQQYPMVDAMILPRLWVQNGIFDVRQAITRSSATILRRVEQDVLNTGMSTLHLLGVLSLQLASEDFVHMGCQWWVPIRPSVSHKMITQQGFSHSDMFRLSDKKYRKNRCSVLQLLKGHMVECDTKDSCTKLETTTSYITVTLICRTNEGAVPCVARQFDLLRDTKIASGSPMLEGLQALQRSVNPSLGTAVPVRKPEPSES